MRGELARGESLGELSRCRCRGPILGGVEGATAAPGLACTDRPQQHQWSLVFVEKRLHTCKSLSVRFVPPRPNCNSAADVYYCTQFTPVVAT